MKARFFSRYKSVRKDNKKLVMSQILCVCLVRGFRRLRDRWHWSVLCLKCVGIFSRYGGDDVFIPFDNPDEDSPLSVFDDTRVDLNVMRFVVYILWLRAQPHSFESFLEVRRQRSGLWTWCEEKLELL